MGDKLPVEKVSWNLIRGNSDTYNWPTVKTVDPNSFIGRIQARTGINFDLPTEAQWEYACRAGTTTTYSYGNSANGDYMWYYYNAGNSTREVGTRLPNALGLYDMHGNVWEWCLDWDGDLSSGTDCNGPFAGLYRVHRGGGCSNPELCTSSYREGHVPSFENFNDIGFRLVGNLSE
jgi:formylglycine-generating enzyme required for sulfatase activity